MLTGAFACLNLINVAICDEHDPSDRYFMSPRIKTLKAILAKLRPEPVREPLPPPPKQYAPPRVTARQRRRDGRCCRIAARTRGGGTLHDGEISLAHCGDLLLGQFAQICGNM
jgi:hypothetical protein